MDILAHRGFWNSQIPQNSEDAFKNALEHGFGIETDIRDLDGRLVISHDMPTAGNMLSLEEFLQLCSRFPTCTLALNIKADGLQTNLKESSVVNPHFFFDMSIPDMLGYKKNELDFFTRYSDIEKSAILIDDSIGVWLDNFSNSNLDVESLNKFLSERKKVALVSPELHNLNKEKYWEDLKLFIKENTHISNNILLCTDHPLEAREYFSHD